MANSRLGVYWSVMHRRQQDYDYFKRLQPSVFKIMDGGAPDYQFAKDNLPNSLVVARDWALSEQHSDMLKDPKGTGIRHAEEWHVHQRRLGFDRANTLILGINEPRVWEPGVPEALRVYTISLCESATALGLRVGAMQLSVGWPNNTGPDTPPNWEPWHGVDNAIRRNNGALIAHEYWADNGPGENWGWWAGRALKCPWQVPIVIGESGVDMYVKDGSVPHASRGWRGRMEPERYAREKAEYVGRMSADPRFVGDAGFASDYASHEWFSFDIEPAYQAILSTPIPAYPPKPFETHLPVIVSPQPTGPHAVVNVPDGANIRFGPGVEHRILGAEPVGTVLEITGTNEARDWYLVDMPHATGWVSATVVEARNTAQVPVVDVESIQTPAPSVPQPSAPGIINPLTALAFLQVESGNVPFTGGLLTIRFEVHRFKANLKNDALFDRHFKFTPGNYAEQYWRRDANSPWQHAHGNMHERHDLLNFAMSLNQIAALRSTGMGTAQIMGENHARIGYSNPVAMFMAFRHPRYGVNAQVMGFVNYCLSDAGLLEALRKRDWMTAVQKYNGTGQEHIYIPALEKALNTIQQEVGK